MIDLFALGLTHALMALAAWRLMARADLDRGASGKSLPRSGNGAGAGDD